MGKILLLSAALGAAAAAFFVLPAPADLVSRAAFAFLPDCQTEDSPGPCAWDASRRGNGRGQSFFVIAGQVFAFEVKGAGQ